MSSALPVISLGEFRALVAGFSVVMLTTVGADGKLGSRPMAPRPLDELQPLQVWFLTRRETLAAQQVSQRSQACVTYQSDDRNLYAVLHGRAEEIRDPVRIKASWRPMDSVFFPEGPESDQLCLIRVFPQQASVWRGPGSLVGKAAAFAQALATGDAGALGQRSDARL